jgi:hypothetical protein
MLLCSLEVPGIKALAGAKASEPAKALTPRAVAKSGARGTKSLATLSLWGAGAAKPPQRPTREYFSGAYGPQTPTECDFATALQISGIVSRAAR